MSKKVILKYIRQKFGYLSMGCSEKSEETGQMEEKCLKNPCTAAGVSESQDTFRYLLSQRSDTGSERYTWSFSCNGLKGRVAV